MNRIAQNNSNRINKIIGNVNTILEMPAFHEKLCNVKSFDYSNIDGKVLSTIILCPPIIVQVVEYRGWFWSRVNGYSNGTEYVYLNNRKYGRSDASIGATIAHEAIHAYDSFVKGYSFGHGTNSSVGKAHTAPWTVGDLVEEIYLSLYT